MGKEEIYTAPRANMTPELYTAFFGKKRWGKVGTELSQLLGRKVNLLWELNKAFAGREVTVSDLETIIAALKKEAEVKVAQKAESDALYTELADIRPVGKKTLCEARRVSGCMGEFQPTVRNKLTRPEEVGGTPEVRYYSDGHPREGMPIVEGQFYVRPVGKDGVATDFIPKAHCDVCRRDLKKNDPRAIGYETWQEAAEVAKEKTFQLQSARAAKEEDELAIAARRETSGGKKEWFSNRRPKNQQHGRSR